MQEAAHALGLQIHVLNATSEGEINSAFAKLAELRAGALIVGTGELFNQSSIDDGGRCYQNVPPWATPILRRPKRHQNAPLITVPSCGHTK